MTFKEIEKLLKRDGWYHYDTVGSHLQYKHPTKPRKSDGSKTWWGCEKRYITINFKTSRFKIENGGKENMKLVYPACFYKEDDGRVFG